MVPSRNPELLETYLAELSISHSASYVRESRRWVARLLELAGDVSCIDLPTIGRLWRRWPVGPNTRATAWWHVRRFVRWAVRHELLPRDPMDGAEAPRPLERAIRVLTLEELQRLRQTLRQADWPLAPAGYAVLEIMVSSAARVGTVLSLRLGDLYLEANPAYAIGRAKGHREQTLLLLPEAVDAIRRYLEHRPRRPAGPSAPVFLGVRGQTWTVPGVWQVLQRAARAAGLPPVHPHLIRHTIATLTLARTRDVRLVQTLLGHRRLDSTMRYVHTAYGLRDLAMAHPVPRLDETTGQSMPSTSRDAYDLA